MLDESGCNRADGAMVEPQSELTPSYDCLEDADALTWLWLHEKPWKIFSFSATQAERRHSYTVFENLAAKRENCHEAKFGGSSHECYGSLNSQGRLLLLEGKAEEALQYLEEAVELCRDAAGLTWLAWDAWTAWDAWEVAWEALLITSKKQNFYRRYLAQQRVSDCCKEALRLQPSALTALCLALLEPEGLEHCTALDPVAHLVAYGRHCLDGAAAQRRAGSAALRRFLAEVNGPADLPTACLLLGELGATPVTGNSGNSTPTMAMVISSKLMALDALWRYWTYVKKPQRATEVSLVAIASLRDAPSAWQRAVTMALKALALDGQWDECWRLASAELSCRSSREILYQCGRLAFYDGREEAISAYLPHMKGMLPAVPQAVRLYLRFWVAMLESKNGDTLVAARTLQDDESSFQAWKMGHIAASTRSVTPKRSWTWRLTSRGIFGGHDAVASSAVWLSARGKTRDSTPMLREGYAEAEPPEQGRSEVEPVLEHRRPPGWSEKPMEVQRIGDWSIWVSLQGNSAATSRWCTTTHASCTGTTTMAKGRSGTEASEARVEVRLIYRSCRGLKGSAWTFFDTWRAARSLKAVEAKDAFLGLLCQGRLHLMNGELDDAQRKKWAPGSLETTGAVIWTSASESASSRVEALLELWNLHDAQNAHKKDPAFACQLAIAWKAVLCARKAFELTSQESQASVEVELIFHQKVWGGTAGESVDCRHWVQLLLAKSLRKCSLWEDAWETLLAASREAVADHPEKAFRWEIPEPSPGGFLARFQGAYGACLYQVLKLCILAAEDAPRHEGDGHLWLNRGSTALAGLESRAVQQSRAVGDPSKALIKDWQRQARWFHRLQLLRNAGDLQKKELAANN
eukprot:s710_g13.t1